MVIIYREILNIEIFGNMSEEDSIGDFVREVASNYNHRELVQLFGRELDDEFCDAILWMETSCPFNLTGSNDRAVIEEYLRKDLIDFFDSKTMPGQRFDEQVEELMGLGQWVKHNDPFCTEEMVRLRTQKCAAVCTDEECSLSGGYAHVGPCEPCTCGMEHAIAECPDRPESIIGFDFDNLEDKNV